MTSLLLSLWLTAAQATEPLVAGRTYTVELTSLQTGTVVQDTLTFPDDSHIHLHILEALAVPSLEVKVERTGFFTQVKAPQILNLAIDDRTGEIKSGALNLKSTYKAEDYKVKGVLVQP